MEVTLLHKDKNNFLANKAKNTNTDFIQIKT